MSGASPGGAPPVVGTTSWATSNDARRHMEVVAALGLLAYSNTFGVPFHFDDGRSIVGNPAVRDLSAFFAHPPPASRFVAYFSFALSGSLGGTSVFGYHAQNLAIHLGAALALYALVLVVCKAAARGDGATLRRAPLAALVAASLFVAHPLQTQAVTYIVQRMASLAALFYLGAVLAYLHAASDARLGRRLATQAAALACAALALFTKENAATLVASLALAELTLTSGTLRQRAARLAPFAVLTLVGLSVLAPAASVGATAKEFALLQATDAPPWKSYALSQPSIVLAYLRLVLLPWGQNIDHDPPVVTSFDASFLLSLAALTAAVAVPAVLALRALHRSPIARIVLFCVGWFVVTLSVESSVIPLADLMVEHRMYLPSAGIFLALGCAVAWALERLGPQAGRRLVLAVGAWVLLLAGATFQRNAVWRDRATLWADALDKSPRKSRPYAYLGQDRLERGDFVGAAELFEKASRLLPPAPEAFLNLGLAYSNLGRNDEAERAYREGIAMGGGALPGAHLRLGMLLFELGRLAEACEELRAEAAVSPESREARANLVACSLASGDARAAVREAQSLDREHAADERVLWNLAQGCVALDDVPCATDAYVRFLSLAGPELEPQRASARRWLEARSGPPR